MYVASQQTDLRPALRGGILIACWCSFECQHTPPKPPPLVELERNPLGVALFFGRSREVVVSG